jgi:polar amino acid transport system permease protein
MPPGVMLRRIILPQVFRRMLPALTNRMIELAKVTSLASILTVNELMYQGRLLSSTWYRPVEIFTVVALLYFVLIWPGSYLAARLERRYRPHP